jgi:hypothetical protein
MRTVRLEDSSLRDALSVIGYPSSVIRFGSPDNE